uniref:Ovule protein n=1 Tax=Haemonchus placei TaxID=6290 RepID=A0A0N4XBY0_HAEPC
LQQPHPQQLLQLLQEQRRHLTGLDHSRSLQDQDSHFRHHHLYHQWGLDHGVLLASLHVGLWDHGADLCGHGADRWDQRVDREDHGADLDDHSVDQEDHGVGLWDSGADDGGRFWVGRKHNFSKKTPRIILAFSSVVCWNKI